MYANVSGIGTIRSVEIDETEKQIHIHAGKVYMKLDAEDWLLIRSAVDESGVVFETTE